MKRKGITPLMAGLLLLSFAVAVGVVVMNLGKAQVEEDAVCPLRIGLHAAVISDKEQLCYNAGSKQFSFTVENGVNTAVTGLVVSVIGTGKAETAEFSDTIAKAGSYVGQVAYDSQAAGEIRQVKITPTMRVQEEELICPEEAIVVEGVREC